jgi:phasin
MASSPFEVPNEVRDFAEKSVDQAKKAFEGFVTVAHKTIGAVDDATASTTTNVKTVSSQVFGYAEQNVNAAFELAHKLVKAKDPQEAIAIQTDFLKAQMAAMQEQAKAIGGMIQSVAVPAKK